MDREAFLDSKLVSLRGLWLRIWCSRCGGGTGLVTDYPIALLARERGGDHVLRDVVPRFRCRQCGGRATLVEITDDTAAGAHGGKPPTWRVTLSP